MIAMQRFGRAEESGTGHQDGLCLFKDLDDAYLGLAKNTEGEFIAIYSKEKIINLLKFRDGLSTEEAALLFHAHIQSQNVGSGTPLILNDCCD